MPDEWSKLLGLSPRVVLFGLAAYYVCLWTFVKCRQRMKGIRLPPGPIGSFIFGNLAQIPKSEQWLTFASWSKTYGKLPEDLMLALSATWKLTSNINFILNTGPVFYLRLFNKETIVLNSSKAVLDLLESRSAIYSERPTFWMAGELAGRKYGVFAASFSDPRHKSMRRLLQQGLNSRAAKSYRPIQLQETSVLLRGLKDNPKEFAAHVRRFVMLDAWITI